MIWYVALGSAMGGVLRFLLGGWIQEKAGTVFPIQTLTINLTGSVVLGLVQRYALDSTAISPEVRVMLTIGLCGGYTTFSTFSYETARLLEDGDWFRASLYVVLSVGLCVTGVIAGMGLAGELLALRGRH